MVMPIGFGDGEADRHDIQEGRIRRGGPDGSEIGAHIEDESKVPAERPRRS